MWGVTVDDTAGYDTKKVIEHYCLETLQAEMFNPFE
jgi:hypothetical protein